MTTTPTPRAVPTPEDRMRDGTAQPTQAPACSHGYTVYRDKHPDGQPCDDARTDRTFATYLDRTERDQLDARAATAEQERDDALDDRDAYREARDVAQQLATFRGGVIEHHRQELGAAGEVIAVVRDAMERIDRALAAYDTRPSEEPDRQDAPHEDPARLRQQLAEAHADCARYATERDEAWRALDHVAAEIGDDDSDLARRIRAVLHADAAKPALGSLPPRAQEPAGLFVGERGARPSPECLASMAVVHVDCDGGPCTCSHHRVEAAEVPLARGDDLADRLAAALVWLMRLNGGEGVTTSTWRTWEALLAEHASRAEREG